MSAIVEAVARLILGISRPHPIRVAIDGIDAAGKTTFADELATEISRSGRPVVRASIDGFHNPRAVRYRRGRDSAEGYYFDSFNYPALLEHLLRPLGPGGSRNYRRAVFDYRSDSAVELPSEVVSDAAVLLFDGVFLLRPELRNSWDFSIFLHVEFEVALARAKQRDTNLFGTPTAVEEHYRRRYFPGQRLYLERCRPESAASVLLNNNDPASPIILSGPWTRGPYGL